MNISPVQLQYYLISKACVTPREPWTLARNAEVRSEPIEWHGVNIVTGLEIGWKNGQNEDPREYALRLGLCIDNKDGVAAPYNVDIECVGYFQLIGDLSKVDRVDFAQVNGAALLFGVLRELLFSLTARFPLGAMILPGVNFLDLRTKHLPTQLQPDIRGGDPPAGGVGVGESALQPERAP